MEEERKFKIDDAAIRSEQEPKGRLAYFQENGN